MRTTLQRKSSPSTFDRFTTVHASPASSWRSPSSESLLCGKPPRHRGRRPDSIDTALPEVLGADRENVVVLPSVEVQFVAVRVAARPDHVDAEPAREAGFEVDTRTLLREVRHHQRSRPYLCDDLVIDLVVMLVAIDP